MTKPITEVTVLMLVEAGQLSLNDPVSSCRSCKRFRCKSDLRHTVTVLRPPTVRDLLRQCLVTAPEPLTPTRLLRRQLAKELSSERGETLLPIQSLLAAVD
jgi:hypothetical protein